MYHAIKRQSLAFKLILPISLTIMVLLGGIFILEEASIESITQNAARETHEQAAMRAARELDTYLNSTERLLALHTIYVKEGTALPAAQLRQLLPDMWQVFSEFTEVPALFFGRADDAFLGIRRDDVGQLQLMESGDHTAFELQFYNLTPSGQAATLTLTDANFYPTQRPWYQAALQTGEAVWSEPFEVHGLKSTALPFSKPIEDSSGTIVGAVGTNLLLTEFDSFLSAIELVPGAEIFVTDGKNNILARSFAIESLALETLAQAVVSQDLNTAPRAVLRLKGQQRNISLRRQVLTHPGMSFTVVSVLDLDQYSASNALNREKTITATSLLIGLICLLSVYLIIRRTVQPLATLADGMVDYAAREPDASNHSQRFQFAENKSAPTETNQLYLAFNHMTRTIDGLLQQQQEDIHRVQKLNTELERLARFARQTDNMVAITNQSDEIIWVNEGFEQQTGHNLSSAMGQSPATLLSGPDTNDKVASRIADAIRNKRILNERILYYTATGEPYWADLFLEPVSDDTNETFEYFWLQRDVTQQVQYERQLSLWQKVFEAADWGVLICNGIDELNICDVNTKLANMFGYEIAELNGRAGEELLPQLASFKRSPTQEQSQTLETECKRKDGSSFPALVNVSKVQMEADEQMVIANVQDLSAIRALQSQLRESHKLETVGLMAAGILHDFNNILGIIQLTAELGCDISDSKDIQELSQQFQSILRNCDRAAAVTGQFLLFIRREAQGFESISLQKLLGDTIEMLATSSSATEVPISIEAAPDAPGMVQGNFNQLQQVFLNLVTNAISAIQSSEQPDGKIEIHLRAVGAEDYYPLDSRKAWVRIEVTDNGQGMPSEVRSRVFEPLFTTKSKGSGTGLGLSIVSQILQNHDAHIVCESEVGKGTTFIIWFPLDAENTDATQTHLPRQLPQMNETPIEPEVNPLIMIVDDEVATTDLWRNLLEKFDWNITYHNDGNRALQDFTNSPGAYDLLLTDLAMPGLKGDELVEEVRKLDQDIPIMVYSALIDSDTAEKLKRLGVSVQLKKPVSSRGLIQNIKQLLGETL